MKHPNTLVNCSARKEVAGKRPLTLITDGLHAYHVAYKREFYAHQNPVRSSRTHHMARRQGQSEDGVIQRHRRSREKTMRSLKRTDTPILTGMQIFHNHMRPHMALDGKTPAEMAGIKIMGKNKWITLIQNAAHQDEAMLIIISRDC